MELTNINDLRDLVQTKLNNGEEIDMETARQCVEALRTERALQEAKPKRRSTKKAPELNPTDLLMQPIGE